MKDMLFNDVKPYVRYSRFIDTDMKKFNFSISAYDCRLFYCTDGFGEMDIQNIRYQINPGTLLLWRPGVPYQYYPLEKKPMQFFGLNFDYTKTFSDLAVPVPPERTELFDAKKIIEDVTFSDTTVLNLPLVIENMQVLYDKFYEINHEYTQKKNYYTDRCSGLLLNILATVLMYGDALNQGGKTTNTVNKIIEYLSKNYQHDLSNESIGKIFGYHPNYVNRLFIKHTGVSLHKYLQNLRILQAIHMLQDTDLSVSEICYLAGFKDFTHFSKYFKKKTGHTPTDFRL